MKRIAVCFAEPEPHHLMASEPQSNAARAPKATAPNLIQYRLPI
jgi:hypothetical protein